MKRAAAIAIAVTLGSLMPGQADEWRIEAIPTPGPVKAIETIGDDPHISIGGGWFRTIVGTNSITLVAARGPALRPQPPGALPDGRIAEGKRDIARVWLAGPTDRYRHGVLGDAIEAGSLVVERRDGRRDTVTLEADAVFEDLEPRIVDLDGDGRERIVVVKSYLRGGSALAVIGERDGAFAIVAETPPIGTPNRWLNPAGIADFDGDGRADIAVVRMPHAAGVLELWSWRDGQLQRTSEHGDVSNHAIGSRVLRMSAVADFDRDGRADLAIPSFDRRDLRIIAFAPGARDVARVRLPARATTELGLLQDAGGAPAVLVGLENGALVAIRKSPQRR